METNDFFVMLNTQRGGYTPLMNDDEIATFDSVDAAVSCAQQNPLGAYFGFEVFERGDGRVFD